MYVSPSGKLYIGQTINEKSRKSKHKSATAKSKTYFGQAIRKYGFENLEYKILIKFKPTFNIEKLKRVLDKLEQRYIKLYKSDEPEFGYNLNKGGKGNIGYKHTDEELKLMSQVGKEKMIDPIQKEVVLNNLSKGWKSTSSKSEETKQKMSSACKNKKCIKQYDLELNLVNTFSSIADAAKSINSNATLKTRSNRISECVNGKQKTAYDFIWVKS